MLEINRRRVTSAAEFRARRRRAAARATPSALLVYDPSLEQRAIHVDRRSTRSHEGAHSRHRRRAGHPRHDADDSRVRRLRVPRRRLRPEGLTIAERETPDLVFLDIKMPGPRRPRGAEPPARHQRDAAGRDRLGARHGGDGARSRAARRVPLHREAAVEGLRARRRARRARARHAAAREPAAAVGARDAASAGRRERVARSRSWIRCGARRRPTRRC